MEQRVTDWFGTWLVQEDGGMKLIEESPEWIAKNSELSKPVPSQDELDNAAFEIRLIDSLMGLGLL